MIPDFIALDFWRVRGTQNNRTLPGERNPDQIAIAVQNVAHLGFNEATHQLRAAFQNFGFVVLRRGSIATLGASNTALAIRDFTKGNIYEGLCHSGLAVLSAVLYQTDVILSAQSEANQRMLQQENATLQANNVEFARNNELLSESIAHLQTLFASFTDVTTDRISTESRIRSVLQRLETLQTEQASTLAGQIQQFFAGTQGKSLVEIHRELQAVNLALQATQTRLELQVNALVEENTQRAGLLEQFRSLENLVPSLFNIAQNSEAFRGLPQQEQEAILNVQRAYERLVGA